MQASFLYKGKLGHPELQADFVDSLTYLELLTLLVSIVLKDKKNGKDSLTVFFI